MIEVKFYDKVDDNLLKFAVIISKSNGKWVFCKHKDRNTYECPGGHREDGEAIELTARRELYEETGAQDYTLKPIGVYSVYGFDGLIINGEETYGMLYYAEINSFETLPGYEMEKIEFFDELPKNWTYPEIQPKLLEYVKSVIENSKEINCTE